MKNLKYNFGIFATIILLLNSCQDDEGTFGDIIAPSNVTISAEIVGVDASNPNGDGTGFVNFTATSNDAITYRYNFGDNTDIEVASSGEVTHRFTQTGTNTYTVTVMASGRGGITTTTSINVDVFSSFEDQEAKDFLSGGAGASKTWYWAADKTGNIGLGPNTVQADNSHTYSAWFTSNAWHADKLCMYDAEFVFTQSADGNLTFEQLTDIAYTPGDFAASIGVDGDSCHGLDVAPSLDGVKNVSFSPSSSIATIDGVDPTYRGTTITFSDNGFMSWYVNVSEIEIIEITDTTLYVRMTDSSNSDLAWYCRYQTDNPND
ncbi:PKD domain-containing protein [Flavivirga aquimarina]|uniref:PKD domain-containing protein n=1 Tax=Flavivirga aquimarina TaxID=2027862 RepID=A0ABT8W7Y2_9FLAO|nr:PKD domain-containing protein [Flavivirga aquimarina]MDO5969189.1 PKD domain-containing protein [Flavivirga aquimarina]